MKVRVTVEVFGDNGVVLAESNQEKAIAEGKIVGDLDIKPIDPPNETYRPILTIRMPNVLEAVTEQIFRDSNA